VFSVGLVEHFGPEGTRKAIQTHFDLLWEGVYAIVSFPTPFEETLWPLIFTKHLIRCGRTAGIVGTGQIGRVTAQILRGFGMRILAYDPFPNREWAYQCGAEYVESVPDLLRNSDVISLHTPLTPETRYLISADTIPLIRPGSILLNVSRGALVDTRALIDALKSRRLAGVGLDVYEGEAGIFFEDLSNCILHDDELARLLTFPSVLITSHQAFVTHEALSETARTTVANISALASQQSFVDGSVVS
jgi:D-lactate dehydrogenase